jgi:signal transduction histidine kinase
MARLLSDFLVLARIGLGSELSLSPAPTRLDELVQQAAKELRAANHDRDISIDVEPDASGQFDPSRMQHVAEDLLAAALEYSEREAPVRVFVDGRKDDELSLRVETKGEIPESVLTRLAMDSSWPADAREARAIGAGLGLVVSREILRSQGGSFTTKAERGTIVFDARVPRRPVVH